MTLLRCGALVLLLPLFAAGSALGGSSAHRAANVCPNGKTFKPDPGFVPQECNQIYRGKTNKGGKVQLKVIYNPDTDKQIVSKFALTAKARCTDGKKRKMLQGFRDQIRKEGEIENGRFEMTREQSNTSRIAVAVKGTVSPRRASGTASWTMSFEPFKGIVNGVPQYGDTITCRSGKHRWSARLVPHR
ncbi:MAG TPA: hypothetical protein VH817_22745 [Thermoleophilaceae bacterium]